jgi:S-adenosylmethionine:tRNA ribosyltransferase-isomerase
VTSNPDPAGPAVPPERLTTSDYDYDLPAALIAHHPARERDASRLLVVRRGSADPFEHRRFSDIVELAAPGDVVVLNETRVFPARLLGVRPGGGEAEIVLLRPVGAVAPADAHDWLALARPGSKLRAGRVIVIGDDLSVEITAVLEDGTRQVRLLTPLPPRKAVQQYGRMPLPPYIERAVEPEDAERYQTVYGRTEGSVAAPTAGLHFTPAVLAKLQERGVSVATVLLHVGVGTFRPVEAEDPEDHVMHAEWYEVREDQADMMNAARQAGGRLWAVGTTVARTLESVVERTPAAGVAVAGPGGAPADVPAAARGIIRAGSGWTSLYIRPGFEFAAVDCLITNFHLPRSTLLMLVSAFAGHELTMTAYREAIAQSYRFYSYGDAMAIL